MNYYKQASSFGNLLQFTTDDYGSKYRFSIGSIKYWTRSELYGEIDFCTFFYKTNRDFEIEDGGTDE
jgi:hypothetical protein